LFLGLAMTDDRPPLFSVCPKETLSMQTRDGVRLDADVYRPDAVGEFPVLLMRQPYGRAISSTVVYAHPVWYAAHGYIVVIQDVRGRGTSEGTFQLFANEIEDGFDAVNWAAQLPGSDGQVGMYGFSYQGMTQLYAAVKNPPALKAIAPAMLAYDLYTDWAYEGGAFCLQANLGWAIQLAAETARRKGDAEAYRTLVSAARNLPVCEVMPTRSGLLKQLEPDSFYHDWLEHSTPGPYWEALSPKTWFTEIDLPMLHIGGWYDTFLRGTLQLYEAMAAQSTQRQQLVIGPWSHLPWSRKAGAMNFGANAVSDCDRLQIRWFDHFLKGVDTGLLDEAPIRVFELGGDRWREFDFWEAGQTQTFYLVSDGLANLREQSGSLATEEPVLPATDFIVHDPWRPVPALGGHAAAPAGCFDRSSLDGRSDIATYTTTPLSKPLHLAGSIVAEIDCTADTPSFDLCAVVSDVHPNGAVYNLAQGYQRVEPGASNLVKITLQSTCACIQPGHALRLSLSGACFPAYPVNDGNGTPAGEARLMNQQIITLSVHSGGVQASRLIVTIA